MKARTALFTIAVGCAGAALAESETSGKTHHGASPFAAVIFSAINLSIFLGVLARYVLPPVRQWVRGRRQHIVQTLEQAATAKAEALRLRDDWQRRLREFEQSVAEMQAQARRDGERERERILEAARKTADAILRDAELAAAYELRRTQQLLRAELVRQALRLAEEAAQARLSADDHRRFINEFLQQVTQ